jgi:hypothetical protein
LFGKFLHMVHAGECAHIVLADRRAFRDLTNRAESGTAQAGDALSDEVHALLDVFRDRVEQQVYLVEILTLHVPVGEFRLAVQIDRIGEAGIQELHQLLSCVRSQIDPGVEPSVFGDLGHARSILFRHNGDPPADWMTGSQCAVAL